MYKARIPITLKRIQEIYLGVVNRKEEWQLLPQPLAFMTVLQLAPSCFIQHNSFLGERESRSRSHSQIQSSVLWKAFWIAWDMIHIATTLFMTGAEAGTVAAEAGRERLWTSPNKDMLGCWVRIWVTREQEPSASGSKKTAVLLATGLLKKCMHSCQRKPSSTEEDWAGGVVFLIHGFWPLAPDCSRWCCCSATKRHHPKGKKGRERERERRENASKIKLGASDRFLFFLSRKLSRH